jgi:hypothetical protein
MRESTSILAFPTILALHTIGMAFVAGINAALAMRILGAARAVPVTEMRRFVPVMWCGFWVNLVSGVALLMGYPTKALTNPMFYLKLVLIAMALGLVKPIHKAVVSDPAGDSELQRTRSRMLAMASLACWALAITAGRLLAYTYSRLMATF